MASKPKIIKHGTLDWDMVETTPVVFRGRLYRFEYVRENYHANPGGKSYFRFVDVEKERAKQPGDPQDQYTPAFAEGYHLGSAFVGGDTMYAFGVPRWGQSSIQVFWSRDLRTWHDQTALDLPGWQIFNTSVCKADGRYVMAFEIGAPPEETGVAFTMRFAESPDLRTWKLTPRECVFSKDRYTACPALRYLDRQFYMIYLEARPGPSYVPHIVRSPDLVTWESSPLNPIMEFSPADQRVALPAVRSRDDLGKQVNINNSDVDLCEWQGKTLIYYSWGNQQGTEFLAEAEYAGPEAEFLRGWFPR